MGNSTGKLKSENDSDSFRDLPEHGHLSEREASSAWYRYGVSITDVYDVVEVLGQGTMGEVFTVRRKTTGHHTDLTREKMKASENDLKSMLKEKEEARVRSDKEGRKKRTNSIGSSSPGRKLSIGDGDSSTPGRKPRPSVLGAARKVKKEIKKGIQKSSSFVNLMADPVIHEDANSNLAPFIKSDSFDPLSEVNNFPPKNDSSTSTPLIGIIRSSNSERLSSGALSIPSDDSETFPNVPPLPLSLMRESTSFADIEKAIKGVHFQRTFAVKTILTSRINKDQLQELVNEIMIMRKLDHPYVLKLYEVYHVKRKLWLVTELLKGGDLSSRKQNEHDTKNVIEMVLRALVYLHRMGIVHRDIKLENILYEDHSKHATVRLIDFGLSRTFDRTSVAADYARTPYTMSPETAAIAVNKKANIGHEVMTDKTDVWAVGVITFIMLSGEFPFIKTNIDLQDKVKMNRLRKADLHFGVTWKGRGITGNAKEFVKGCLQLDASKRWTAKQALEFIQKEWGPGVDKIWDDWEAERKKHIKPEILQPQDLSGDSYDSEDENSDLGGQSSTLLTGENDDIVPPPSNFDNQARAKYIKNHVKKVVKAKKAEGIIDTEESWNIDMEGIERYTKYGVMKKTILITMANTMDRSDVGELGEIFLEADTEDTGTITLKELIAAFHKISPEVDEKRAEDLFLGIDRDKSGHIHYAEFLAALAESHGLVTLDRLTEAFDRIDTDGKGYITHDDLKSILGKDYDKEIVDAMIKEGDFKKNNKIDYEGLLQLMFSDPVKGDELAGSVSRDALGSVSPGVSFGESPTFSFGN